MSESSKVTKKSSSDSKGANETINTIPKEAQKALVFPKSGYSNPLPAGIYKGVQANEANEITKTKDPLSVVKGKHGMIMDYECIDSHCPEVKTGDKMSRGEIIELLYGSHETCKRLGKSANTFVVEGVKGDVLNPLLRFVSDGKSIEVI